MLPYFIVTFAWTWSLWWSAAAFGITSPLLFMAGGLGPLAGAAWALSRRDGAYMRDFLRRTWDPRGISSTSWLALVAVAAGPAFLGAGVALAAGSATRVPDTTVATVAGVVMFALAAGLVEEPGWRGAALDIWQRRTTPVLAAAATGALWALWHLPLYFIEGTYQHGLGFGTTEFWLTNLVLIELGVLFVWLTNSAGRSILIVILAHAGFNIAATLVPRSTLGEAVAVVAVTVGVLAVIAATRGGLSSPDAVQVRRQMASSD